MMATSSSHGNATGGSKRRPRYWSGSRPKYRQKPEPLKLPYLGFDNVKPVFRTTLDLDTRFFIHGIPPGTIMEIKGPEKSGKTFLLTYMIARLLTNYPEKKAVLINTRHKFNVRNYLSVISKCDSELKRTQINFNRRTEDLIKDFPKLGAYMDRLLVIPCYSAEDLMLILGPSGESMLQKLLLREPTVNLVAIDSIDAYSIAESLQGSWKDNWPGIMECLKEAVSHTKCPVFCTTLMSAHRHEYKSKPFQRNMLPKSAQGPSTSRESAYLTKLPPPQLNGEASSDAQEENIASNFTINYTVFTKILEIVLASEAEKRKVPYLSVKSSNHYAKAYLCSRHNAKTAGSGENHRVRFSIFSDMLYVE